MSGFIPRSSRVLGPTELRVQGPKGSADPETMQQYMDYIILDPSQSVHLQTPLLDPYTYQQVRRVETPHSWTFSLSMLPPSGRWVFVSCSVNMATRRKRSAPLTPWMKIQLSRSSSPHLAPGPVEAHWAETDSFFMTWCLYILPLLPPPPPQPPSPFPSIGGQSQRLQDYPVLHPPPFSHNLTYRWTMVRTTFPRWPILANSSRSREMPRRCLMPCQAWTVRVDKQIHH